MPDLIRHPDIVPTTYQVPGKLQSGTISRLDPGFHREPWIPAFAGMTILIEVAIYKQTLMNLVPIRGTDN
jgi:hypothetical protein